MKWKLRQRGKGYINEVNLIDVIFCWGGEGRGFPQRRDDRMGCCDILYVKYFFVLKNKQRERKRKNYKTRNTFFCYLFR